MRPFTLASFTSLLHISASRTPPNVLQHVSPLVGTSGPSPNSNGGMIPSVAPPFAMTRWTPQTRENFISQCPYSFDDAYLHGFQATHQPAIWMGESGQVVLVPGVGEVKPWFWDRGRRKLWERSQAFLYEVEVEGLPVVGGVDLMEDLHSPVPGGAQEVPEEVTEGANGRVRRDERGGPGARDHSHGNGEMRPGSNDAAPNCEKPKHGAPGSNYDTLGSTTTSNGIIKVAMTASSHVGHLRVDFPQHGDMLTAAGVTVNPHVFIQATRQNWTGYVDIDPVNREVSGSNPQRQDYALGPHRAPNFSGYFVSRFSEPFLSYGIAHGSNLTANRTQGTGEHLGAYVTFSASTSRVEVRTGVSFLNIAQARRNLDIEAPSSLSFDTAVQNLEEAWLEKLSRVVIKGANTTSTAHNQLTIFYTALFHALQYPADFSEPLHTIAGGLRTWYEGYTDSVQSGNDSYYQSWSVWDTFRAEHSLLTLFAPERVNSMMRSLLKIYGYSGRLPMWANVVETNIMIGTHVDAVIANALERGFTGFDVGKAWDAVKKNAFEPPERDEELLYYDREGYTPMEVRAGLTAYMEKGYVPNDQWAEAGSRTLDYAFDDYAAGVVARHAGDNETAAFLFERSNNYCHLFSNATGFMQSRNANGSWANATHGWTEGDAWIYTFNVMHDVDGLASLFGSREAMKVKLDEYFSTGQNDHTNEPSHHAPYLYSALGYPYLTANLTRQIAAENYNATPSGLSGNEDLGQMSAWYSFSALGFYPLNPASREYVVGAPFFEEVRIKLPAEATTGGEGGEEREVIISAPGAQTKAFVKGLRVDGREVTRPVLRHEDIVKARRIEFDMSDEPTDWGREGL
nr:hypothetical protein B0A51_18043 [Rachicladosporium sp. CCFEE 5018]